MCRVSNTRQDELTDHFFFLLHQHHKKERSVSFYADKLYISDKYLMRVLKKSTGQTFHFWVIEFIMREAKLLLRSTTISITEISEKLNYPTLHSSPAYSTSMWEWPQKSSGISDPEIFYGHRLLKANGFDIYRQELIVRNDDFCYRKQFNIWWYMVAKCLKNLAPSFYNRSDTGQCPERKEKWIATMERFHWECTFNSQTGTTLDGFDCPT